jgi:hypothetical protein
MQIILNHLNPIKIADSKGQLISKGLFGSSILPKNKQKNLPK